jgi:biopolymer transport protein ExbD
MRLTNRRHGSKIDLQMTSMIDCVFLLLIFFMVTSSFNRTERELDTGLATEARTVKAAGDLAPIVVEVIRAEGAFVFKVGGRQLPSREELTDVLRKIENKLDGAFVRAADDAPFLMASGAIQACKDAGFLKTTYAPRLDTK